MTEIDQTDHKIIQLLRENARMSFSEIGNRTSLSTPAVSNRVQKLQEQGVICYCQIFLQSKQKSSTQVFLDMIQEEPDIWEAYCISGDYEYLLKIVTSSTQSLESILAKIRSGIPAIKTKSSIVLSSLRQNLTKMQFERDSPVKR